MAGHPRTIGRYEVLRLLGQGGMGRVYLARDTVLGRRVAIKTLRDDLALPPRTKDELVERMRHEAQAAAAVSHPNIVTLHDMGEDDAVGLYLVFEYVPSPSSSDSPESLRERLRRGPLPLAEVGKIARELGWALSFAHEAGVIHRDIKPENILFSRTGAKIADFGIARIPESTITRANTVLGTPAYTAPEALSKGEFGPASDQFAFAAALYEAATATRAFGSADAITTAGRVSNDPPPPIDAAIAQDPARRNLEAALFRGLAKVPLERFASCADLGEAIAKAVEAPALPEVLEVERTPLSSRMIIISDRASQPPGPGEPSRPSVLIRQRTHRSQNIVAAIALVVIAVLVVLGRRSSERHREAVNAETMAPADAGAEPEVVPLAPAAPPPRARTPKRVTPPPLPAPSPDETSPSPAEPLASTDAGALHSNETP